MSYISEKSPILHIPADFLRECFDYSPDSGVIKWRVRPPEHFGQERDWKTFTSRFSNKPAGKTMPAGYVKIKLQYDDRMNDLMAHHIAMVLSGVELQVGMIVDHKNRECSDNRFSNLRQCLPVDSAKNRGLYSNNKSGHTGVVLLKKGAWAKITVNKKVIKLGTFDTVEEAVAARKAAEIKYFGEFNPNADTVHN